MSIIIKNKEYKIIKKLGQGGYGKVIQVKSKSDNKYYAIKEIMIKDEMKDKIENIKKEADILSKFNCKNIVKYYDSCLDKNKFYIVMEYCNGENLRDFINKNIKNKKLIEENILYNIIKQICIGIKEIHNKNIIHRDIKPENIFINEKMDIKIGDFGISKQFYPNKEYMETLYKTGSIFYMAPEILAKGIFNKRSDMYSFGCIIYELFTLSKYYDDRDYEEIKQIDSKKYNNKWQEIINSLLETDDNKRMEIDKVYNIILNEININKLEKEIKKNKSNNNSDTNGILELNKKENAKKPRIGMLSQSKLNALKIIREEFKRLCKTPLYNFGITVCLFDEDNLFEWKGTVIGPRNSPYRNGLFYFKILFPDDYPNSRPEICFLTPIYHLNIKYFVGRGVPLGHVGLSTLKTWDPGDSIITILPHIFVLLLKNNPNTKCAYDDENNTRRNEFINNRPLFDKKAKFFTKKYASPLIKGLKDYPNGWDFSY